VSEVTEAALCSRPQRVALIAVYCMSVATEAACPAKTEAVVWIATVHGGGFDLIAVYRMSKIKTEAALLSRPRGRGALFAV